MAPGRPASPSVDRSDPAERGDDPVDPLAAFRAPPLGPIDRLTALRERYPASPGRIVAVVLAVAVLAGGGWWLLRPPAPPLEASLPRAGEAPAAGGGGGTGAGSAAATTTATVTTTSAAELVVQAAGAVARPGVYRLPGGARVDDLVRAAGGLTGEADGDRVNLAAPLADGQRIWVPRRGEAEVPDVVVGDGGGPTGGGGASDGPEGGGGAPTELVDLNTADAAALDTLPGVGPSTAQAILAHRTEHGPFAAVDDLLEVRGIGEAKLEQLRPLVRVG